MHSSKSARGNELLREPPAGPPWFPALSTYPQIRPLCSRLTFRPDSSFLLIRASWPIFDHYFHMTRGFSLISGKPGEHDGAPEFALVVRNAPELPFYRGLVIDHVLIMYLPAQSPRDFAPIQDDRHIRSDLEMKIEDRVVPAEESHIPHGWPFAIVVHGVGRLGFYQYDGNKPPGSRVFKYGDPTFQLPEDWYHLVDDWEIVVRVLSHMALTRLPLHQQPPYPATFHVPQMFTLNTMLMLSVHPAMREEVKPPFSPQDLPAAPEAKTPTPQQSLVSQELKRPESPGTGFIDPNALHLPGWKESSRYTPRK